jgi:glyoxylase-like metal-dependent hydrolase (beta-lactamase superfamily II)
VDQILITHGHADAWATVAIAKKTKAWLVTTADQSDAMVPLDFPAAQTASTGGQRRRYPSFDGEVKTWCRRCTARQ